MGVVALGEVQDVVQDVVDVAVMRDLMKMVSRNKLKGI